MATEHISPAELEPGDVIVDEGVRIRVVGEPMTMHTGLGLFDEFRLMIGALVAAIGGQERSFRVWAADAVLARATARRGGDER